MNKGVQVESRDQGWNLLTSPSFQAAWRQLYNDCPWATPFQSPCFVLSWLDVYKKEYSPLVVCEWSDNGSLKGLLILARGEDERSLSVAGGHQAEYQTWLADDSRTFIVDALSAVEQQIPGFRLIFRNIPDNASSEALFNSREFRGRCEVLQHDRPLWKIDSDELASSLRKKSNKSRLNRLKRHGNLSFKRIVDAEEFSSALDPIIPFYDLRQGAVNDSYPFLHDGKKKPFHTRLFSDCPELLHVTVMTLDDQPISMHVGIQSKDAVHLAIIAHSPMLARYSPGKIHLLLLASRLIEEGTPCLDLTPGGDPWKERYASEHDSVQTLTIYSSNSIKRADRVTSSALDGIRSTLRAFGISPLTARRQVMKLARPNVHAIKTKIAGSLWTDKEYRIYVSESPREPDAEEGLNHVQRNCIQHLLLFEPAEPWQSRQRFMQEALNRLEQGEHVYTIADDNVLQHYGWFIELQEEAYFSEVEQRYRYPEKGAVLYDFYTHPGARGQGFYQRTIARMRIDAAQDPAIDRIYISCLADNFPSRHVIEKAGFNYLQSLHLRRRAGRSVRRVSYETG